MLLQRVDQRHQPARFNEAVAIHQRHGIDAPQVIQGQVVAARKSQIRRAADKANCRKSAREIVDRSIRRSVVNDHDLHIDTVGHSGKQRSDRPSEEPAAVEVDHHHPHSSNRRHGLKHHRRLATRRSPSGP
jgi:hypothetical protein